MQQPHPPIWAGGNSDRPILRAAEHCDSRAPLFASGDLARTTRTDDLASIADLRDKLDEHLARVERTRPSDVCVTSPVGFAKCDADEVRAMVDFAGELAEPDVSWTVLSLPHPSRAAYLDNVRWLSEKVLAKVHSLGPPAGGRHARAAGA